MENYGHQFHDNEAKLPPGFRFHPTDEELTVHYLLKKVINSSFTSRAITDVDLNKCEPWELPEKAKMGEKRLEGKFAYHFLSESSKKIYTNPQDEWVISRVFQKTSGPKKARSSVAGGGSACESEVSYSSIETDHMPCFSTLAGTYFPTAVHPASSAFSELRSVQDNLQLPFFLSAIGPPALVRSEAMNGLVGTELNCMWTF
ncbi:Protein CUP-SHAPED COTYLEDON 2 [Platanthera zijinensis]|uniref:Protein CUP-SHAPED COTYLEDON 2 n=1 Tax=Platanthera zijinensis TaxID=2320716 RepID=A0AAP0ASW7_9ASPA